VVSYTILILSNVLNYKGKTMQTRKTLTSLAVCLSLWIGIVFVMLLYNGTMHDSAIATPISADMKELTLANDLTPASVTIDDPQVSSANHSMISGEIKKGESFDLAMKRLNISETVRLDIINGFSKKLDFKMLQPGDRFSISLNEENVATHVTYESGLLNTHILERNDQGDYLAIWQPVPLVYRLERLSGVIDSSLYAAFLELGEEPKLIHAYADIFASKIDFNTETRAGDRFELLVEKYYKDDIFVGYGKILGARYQQENGEYVGYYFTSEETPAGYFDKNGEALGTWFIRSPIPFGRVTSNFTMRRKHPVDGVVRPHLGVDLAAPKGTPVLATAEGKVEFIGWKGGFGKTIILRHHGGYKTYYGHLSGYKKGLKAGSTVQQKDIIAYVGSTGISTGPHLDYRIQCNGVFKNPFGIKFKAKAVLQEEELALFLQSSFRTAELFNAKTSEKTLQVKNLTLTENDSISFL
jgi:murein DD-endopeptidase MepM/ murein hydrolase activator NlpD